jgi:murein DD-endopeptidase MepM/ murein hydrolase activator NlpD
MHDPLSLFVTEAPVEPYLTRREFARRSARWMAGVAAALGGCAAPRPVGPALDLSPELTRPGTPLTGRTFPRIFHGGTFAEHRRRPEYRALAGIDYAPAGAETEIVPVAAGVVYGYFSHPMGGNAVVVHHGLGFVSQYFHLQERTVALGDLVTRDTVVGLMGATGSGARTVGKHVHLTVLAPFYAAHLQLDDVQYFEANDTVSSYVVDPEEFSVLGRHRALPLARREDAALDERFRVDLREARIEVDRLLRLFPRIQRTRFSERFGALVTRVGSRVDLTLDRDAADLYQSVASDSPGARDADPDRIRASLARIMALTPRFTAPVKDGDRPEFSA